MNLHPRLTKVGLAGAGLTAGVVLATTLGAQAATSTPSPSTSTPSATSTVTPDAHQGDNGADGIPESQEVHGHGRGGALDLSGTVTAVGTSSVTIKTATATKAYAVTSSSDIDKNGEAALKDLAVGDAVTFSVDSTATTTIDKLHAGDEAKNMPAHTADSTGSTTTSGA